MAILLPRSNRRLAQVTVDAIHHLLEGRPTSRKGMAVRERGGHGKQSAPNMIVTIEPDPGDPDDAMKVLGADVENLVRDGREIPAIPARTNQLGGSA